MTTPDVDAAGPAPTGPTGLSWLPVLPGSPGSSGLTGQAMAPPVPQPSGASQGFSPEAARRDVPILHRTVNGHPLVWLDNGATTQKPRQVIEALAAFYGSANSNIHRGAHTMAREATEMYEAGRATDRKSVV